MSALEQFLCQWGRVLMVRQGATPCPNVGTAQVVLHDPDDRSLSSRPIRLCDEHLQAIADTSTPTTEDRIDRWQKRWDSGGQYEHKPGMED